MFYGFGIMEASYGLGIIQIYGLVSHLLLFTITKCRYDFIISAKSEMIVPAFRLYPSQNRTGERTKSRTNSSSTYSSIRNIEVILDFVICSKTNFPIRMSNPECNPILNGIFFRRIFWYESSSVSPFKISATAFQRDKSSNKIVRPFTVIRNTSTLCEM